MSQDDVPRMALVGACLVLSLPLISDGRVQTWIGDTRFWGLVTQDDRQLSAWLTTHARADEMLLTSVHELSGLQIKTGHPILMEGDTFWLMTYMPGTAAPIGTMSRDLYGVDYDDPVQVAQLGRDTFASLLWRDRWRERGRREWQSIGQRYRFRLVLAPLDVPLDLPVVLQAQSHTLYAIP